MERTGSIIMWRDAEQFRQIFEHAPIGIYLSDPDGRLIQVNPAFCRMLGYSEQELIGAAWSDLTYPDDLPPASLRKEQLWSGVLNSFEAETRFVHRSGTMVWTRIRVSLIRDAGATAYSLVHVEDVTDGKLTRKALEESEGRFRIMADGCPTMLWVTTAAGETQFINRAFREFFGLECDQIEHSDDWRQLIHPDERNAYVNAFDRAVREHAPFEAEARVRRADGEWRWVNSRADPRFSPDGEFLGLVGLSPDITGRKEAERHLRISEEKFRQLTANIDEVFWLTDPSGTELHYVSPAYESIWRRSCADLYANPKIWMESIHPEDRASAERVFRRQGRRDRKRIPHHTAFRGRKMDSRSRLRYSRQWREYRPGRRSRSGHHRPHGSGTRRFASGAARRSNRTAQSKSVQAKDGRGSD